MSEAKHTAGPWSFDGPHHSIIVWGPEAETRVCFMTSNGPAKANARLISSAPDLLEALQFISEGYANQDVSHVDFRVKAAQVADAAIAKALGHD